MKQMDYIPKMLKWIVGRTNNTASDATSWMIRCLANSYEDEFIAVAREVGITCTVKPMDTPTTAAMWEEGNINITAQHIIVQFMHGWFG